MHISLFKKTQKIKHKKDGRINPHRFWIFLMTALLLVLTVEVIASVLFFTSSLRTLDSTVEPRPDTNSGQIKKIEKMIQKTEDSVSVRQGASPSSQNSASIVQ